MSTGPEMGTAGEAPYFFLSYAHTPRMPGEHGDPDRWIAKLYTDLCTNVIHLTSGRSAAVGFMDREMRAGAAWPRRLAEALSCCRVFVPLYSPRYFESEECGKEWFAFSRRMRNRADSRGEPQAEAIVPALWVPVDPDLLPPVAKSIQFSHHLLGERYGQEGFWGIMKVQRYQDDYEFAVLELAKHIVQVARRTRLGQEPPADYNSLPSAFGTRATHRASHAEQSLPQETTKRAGRRINIMIAAPTTQNIPRDRQGEVYYGASEREWNPYHPESHSPLADFATDLTSGLGYRPMVVPFGELPGVEATGSAADAPGLFLVDPWVTATDGQATRLAQFDEQAGNWISVLIPSNRADGETMAAEPTLRPRVTGALSRMLDHIPLEYRQAANSIPTLGDFADILPPMARIADNRYLRYATAYPPGGPARRRPMLGGPYPNDSEGTP